MPVSLPLELTVNESVGVSDDDSEAVTVLLGVIFMENDAIADDDVDDESVVVTDVLMNVVPETVIETAALLVTVHVIPMLPITTAEDEDVEEDESEGMRVPLKVTVKDDMTLLVTLALDDTVTDDENDKEFVVNAVILTESLMGGV